MYQVTNVFMDVMDSLKEIMSKSLSCLSIGNFRSRDNRFVNRVKQLPMQEYSRYDGVIGGGPAEDLLCSSKGLVYNGEDGAID